METLNYQNYQKKTTVVQQPQQVNAQQQVYQYIQYPQDQYNQTVVEQQYPNQLPPQYQIIGQQIINPNQIQIQQQNQGYHYVPTVPVVIEPDAMNCIIPPSEQLGGLYLGGLDAALDVNLLKKHKIKAVLTCSIETPIQYSSEVITFHEIIQAHDRDFYDITQHFEKAIEFIDRHRRYTSVLVHCYAGVSRSASCVIAYLMKVYKWPLEKCLWFCRQKRRFVKPNPGFMKKLIETEKSLLGLCSISKRKQQQIEAQLPTQQQIDIALQQQIVQDQLQNQQQQHVFYVQSPQANIGPQQQQQQQQYAAQQPVQQNQQPQIQQVPIIQQQQIPIQQGNAYQQIQQQQYQVVSYQPNTQNAQYVYGQNQ